ncbi:hypothetical protein [Candidatus Sororendozoicomonas aggregata]|uniref:hypothetical protein n=1 Tax=Candidatus Sororendozoicomonas aggregata TaxID=3073239 RepID=UPI002ED565E4
MANRKMPSNVHKMRGTHRKDRHGTTSEKALLSASYPGMPEHVADDIGAAKVWEEVRAAMSEANIYTSADSNKLARYCILEAGFRADPVGFSETAARLTQLRLLENDLYLSPESRAKVGGKKDKKSNRFSDF